MAKKNGKHTSQNNKHAKTLKVAIPIIVIAIALVLFVVLKQNTNLFNFNQTAEQQSVEEQAEGGDELNGRSSDAGQIAYVSSAQITGRTTGTGPWDENDEPGNDSSPDNNIVRSFDQVTWTVEVTMDLKEGAGVDSITGGTIRIEATLPEECANVMEWDLNSMEWLEGTGSVSEDGRTLTGSYVMSENTTTVPGKQNLLLILKLYGAKNETNIKPDIKIWLDGNTEEEKQIVEVETVIVSATEKYNVDLDRNNNLAKEIDVNIDGEVTRGRVYGYSLVFQLYNDDGEEKGLKGIQYPENIMTLDVNLKLEKVNQNNLEDVQDITKTSMPILYNYDINGRDTGKILNRSMDITSNSHYNPIVAGGNGGGIYNCYNSGNVLIEQNNSLLKIMVKDYQFNGNFPTYTASGDSRYKYDSNIGCFASIYFMIFVPYTKDSSEAGYDYYLTVEDVNLKEINEENETKQIEQIVLTDDSSRYQHQLSVGASFTEFHWLKNNIGVNFRDGLYTHYTQGDAKAEIGQKFVYENVIATGNNNDLKDDIYSANVLVKFDGEAFNITELDGKEWSDDYQEYNYSKTKLEFNMIYVAKPDGTNWSSDQEMKDAVEEDLKFYSSIDDLKANLGENAICVGVLYESIDGKQSYGIRQGLELALQVTEKAEIGKVYQFVSVTRLYKENNQLDRTTQTRLNPEAEFPKADVEIHKNYIKSEYDESGEIKTGTHLGAQESGQSLLIVAGNLSVNYTINDKTNDGNIKTNYDLGRGENIVCYKIQPQLTSQVVDGANKENNVTVTVKATLPKGLTYVPGSSDYVEPEIIENEDGSTTVVWEIYNCSVGEAIRSISYEAKIDEDTANATQYETSVVVSADKIGNAVLSLRTDSVLINITNLSSHRLYKESSTPVLESNGEIIYTVTYQNNTDTTVPDFQILDILPYNGDGRGTLYKGTYTLKSVDVTSVGDEISVKNLKLYMTTNLDARKLSPKDESIGVSEIWQEENIGEEINEQATVIALKGEIGQNTDIQIEITLQTTNNRGGDVYYNQATAQISKDTEVITTTNIRAEVVSRQITGTIWYDTNENGVIDEGESYANRIEVELLKADGSKAVDYNGNEIQNILTNSDGEYTFTNLPMGEYIVEIHTDDRYTLTTANVGTNREINSKFEETEDGSKQSYTITNLNGIQSPEIIEANVNAGLVVKDAKIIVKYLEEDSTPETDEDNRVLKEQDEITTYEKDGEQVKYKLGDSYTTSPADIENYIVLRNGGNTVGTLNAEETVVTYYYAYNLQDITVSKVWEDNHDVAQKRPASIKVTLKDGSEEVKEIVLNADNLVSKDQAGINGISDTAEVWQGIIEDVPVYNEAGQRISYTIDEKEDDGTLDSYNKTINGMVITNTFTQNTEKIEILVTKVWEDNDNKAGKRPTKLTLILKREVATSLVESREYAEVERVSINGTDNQGSNSNEWTYTFTNIAKYDENNNEINYIVEEEVPEFYTSRVETVENTEEEQDSIAFKITNTFKVPEEKVSYEVTKIWNDNNNRAGKRPEEVTLVLTGKNSQGEEVVEPHRITLTKADATDGNTEGSTDTSTTWKGTIGNLPKYDENADIITYEISEENLNNIFYTASNTTINQSNKTVINRFEVPDATIDVEVTKVWNDSANSEGVRPESVTLYLTGNGQEKEITLTKANAIDGNTEGDSDTSSSWKGTIAGLTKYDVNGNEINYVLDERPVTSEFYTKTSVDQSTKTVTNTFGIPTESIQITVTKIWEDNNNALGKRPENITLQIKNKTTGQIVASQLVQGSRISNDGWTYTFEVPKYAGSTDEVEYEIAEADLNNIFYTAENTIVDQETRTITNRFAIPNDTIELPVRKEWNHTNNSYKIPQEVKIQVKDETGAVVAEQILNSSNKTEDDENVWEYTITGLKKYNDQAEEKKYTIDEEAVTPGDLDYYSKEINGTTIKNTYIGPIVSAEKTATTQYGQDYVVEGEKITYIITVKNDGGLSKDVVIKDTIPDGTTFVEGSIEISNNENTANLGETELESGITVKVPAKTGEQSGTTTLSFKVAVQDLENETEIKNIATVDGNNTNETINTYLEPIISMEKTQETENKQDYVVEGEKITYTITVKNDGGLSKDVKIQDTIPEGTSFVEGIIKVNGQARTELTQENLINGITENVPAKEGEEVGTLTVSFEVIVDNLPEGTYTKDITNTATVDETLEDTVQTTVKKANVITSKSSNPESGTEVKAGDEITYTIKLDNSTGTLPETVKVKDTIPEGTEFVEGSIKIGGQAQKDLTQDNLTQGIDVTVEAENTNTLEFKVKVVDDDTLENGNMIKNQATVEEPSGKETQTNETEHRYIEPIINAVKIQTAEHTERDYVLEGEIITYTITVTNTGDLEKNVVVRDNIPSGTTLVPDSIQIIENTKDNNTPKEETFTQDNLENGIEVNVGAKNESTITFQVTVNQLPEGQYEAEIVNTAVVDEKPTNDVKIEVHKPHITATKEAETAGDTVTTGDKITYTISLTNDGTAPGEVTLKDTAPTGTSFYEGSIEVQGDSKVYNIENLINGIPVSLEPDETKTVKFTVIVNEINNDTEITNYATIEGKDTGTNVTNTVKVRYLKPIIKASKEATTENGLGYVVEGEKIIYTITVTNEGGLGKLVTVQDKIPDGTTFVPNSIKVNNEETEYTDNDLKTGITEYVDANEEIKVSFDVTVNTLPEGELRAEIVNKATVDGEETNETTNIVNKADVKAQKTSTPPSGETVENGEEITYTITVTNDGTAPATARVTDSIPTGTTFVDGSIVVEDSTDTYGLSDLTTNGIEVALNPKESKTVEFKVTVNDLDNGVTIENIALVDGNSTNKVEHRYVEPIISGDKSIETEYGEDYVVDGEKVTYTITAKNDGDLEKLIKVSDEIPTGTTFVENSIKIDDGETSYTAEELEEGIDVTVPAREETKVTFQVTVNELPENTYESIIRNIANVDGTDTQEVTKNVYKPNFTFNKDSDPANGEEVTAGNTITYRITVENIGKAPGEVVVKDEIPEGTTFVRGNIKVGEQAQTSLTEDSLLNGISLSLNAGETKNVEFKVTVNDIENKDLIRNIATVNGESTNETIHTYVEPIISSTKAQTTENNLDYVIEGEKVTYTVTVTNTGDLAKNVTIQDTIPTGTTFVEGSITIVENGTPKEGTFTESTLEDGIEVNVGAQNETTLTFQVEVNDLPEGKYEDTIRNTATVDGTNTNEETVEVKKAHVRIGKTSDPASGSQVVAGQEIRYMIVLENKEGTAPSTLVVKDSIPEGTTFVEGSIRVNDTELGNTLEDLTTNGITVDIPAGKTSTVEFKVKVQDLDNGYIIRNKANITNPKTQESKDTNEVTHEYVEAIINAEKEMATERGLSYVIPGEKVTYTIRVQNEGDLSKTLTVKDNIPRGTEFAANSVHLNGIESNITQDQLEHGFEIEVAGKQIVTISFDVTVLSGATEIKNTAVVDGTSTNETKVPVVTYEKTAEVIRQTEEELPEGTVTTGDKIKYTIKINNLGEEPIDSIVVKDTIPEGTTLSNINNDGIKNDRNEIKWNVTNLQPETSTEVSFKVTVNYDTLDHKIIENIATVDEEETNKVETPYDKPEIKEESSIEKVGTEVIKSTEDSITYRITYNATIKDFVGEGKVSLVDYLPYEIDVEHQNLNGGLYDSQTKTITWEQDLGAIDTYTTNKDKVITIEKEITVKYLYGEDAETLSGTIPNRVEGTLQLTQEDPESIGQDKVVLEDTKQANFDTRVEIPTYITVHHYIEGTNQKVPSKVYGQVVEDEIQEGYVGQSYTTNASSNVQENYQVVSNSGNTTGTMTRTPIEVIYYYRLQPADITENTITKDGTDKIINKDEKVSYTIKYNAQITDYVGNVKVEIVDYLPYAIDESLSNLHGGTYNPEGNTVTWEVNLGRINTYTNPEQGNISITKNIEVVFTEMNYTGESFTNRVQGKVILEETNQEEQTPEASKVTETEFVKDITVEKVWDDNNNVKGNRPESVTVQLTANENTSYNNQQLEKVVLNDTNNWTHTFTNLPKYTEQGNEISYSAIETETTEGDLEYYSEPVIENFDNGNKTTIRITNKYRLMNTDLDASIKKTGTEKVTNSKQEVNYNIKYKATVEDYIGETLITITDYLPYAIDEEKSDLDGGTYDSISNTITWQETIDHINTYENGDYEVSIDKNITVVFTNLDATARSFTNKVNGTIDLYETEQTNTVETTYETKVEIPGNVVVKHVDKQTGTEIAEREELKGLPGDTYTTEQKDIYGYTFIESTNNTSGNMIEGTIEVTYYYTRTNAGGVIVHYIDEDGNKLVKDELITGKVADPYETEQKDIPNYDFVRVEGQTQGELVEGTIEVTYVYKKIPARVIVQYLEKDDTLDDNTDNVVLAEQEIIEGYSGDPYMATRKEIENFQVTIPENEIGTMTREDIYVIYYYERKPSGIVTVKYVDVDTNEEILHKADTEQGQEYISYREQLQGLCGLEYEAEQKDIPYYNFVEELRPSNATGVYTEEDIEVIYYYRKQTFNLSVNKQIERITVNGVEHSLKDGLDQIDVVASKVQETDIVVTYKIIVSNPSEIEGTATVIENIPDFFRVADGTSSEWTENGKSLEDQITLQPGETKELTVVLRWIKNTNNFGLQINTVTLQNVTNPVNFEETTLDDNTSIAEVIFSVKTGGIDTAIIIGTALIIMIGALMITIYLKEKKKK